VSTSACLFSFTTSVVTRTENGSKKMTFMIMTFPIAVDSHVVNVIVLKEHSSRV